MSKLKTLIALAMMLSSVLATAAEVINVNAADAATLATGLVGIGPAKAAAIVAYREQHGPFKTVDDLLLVQGIGEETLARNRERLSAATP